MSYYTVFPESLRAVWLKGKDTSTQSCCCRGVHILGAAFRLTALPYIDLPGYFFWAQERTQVVPVPRAPSPVPSASGLRAPSALAPPLASGAPGPSVQSPGVPSVRSWEPLDLSTRPSPAPSPLPPRPAVSGIQPSAEAVLAVVRRRRTGRPAVPLSESRPPDSAGHRRPVRRTGRPPYAAAARVVYRPAAAPMRSQTPTPGKRTRAALANAKRDWICVAGVRTHIPLEPASARML